MCVYQLYLYTMSMLKINIHLDNIIYSSHHKYTFICRLFLYNINYMSVIYVFRKLST